MENLWLVAQLRQPGRAIYKDLTATTFTNFQEFQLQDRSTVSCTLSRVGPIACHMNMNSGRKLTRSTAQCGWVGFSILVFFCGHWFLPLRLPWKEERTHFVILQHPKVPNALFCGTHGPRVTFFCAYFGSGQHQQELLNPRH